MKVSSKVNMFFCYANLLIFGLTVLVKPGLFAKRAC